MVRSRCFFLVGLLMLVVRANAAPAGEDLFVKNCAACHGKDGKAKTPIGRKLGAKDLALSKTTPAQIEKQILDGMTQNGIVKMPGFAGKLSKEEIGELVGYVQKLRK